MATSTESKAGYIYVARNNAHPKNVYKVGKTTKTPMERERTLSDEKNPLPFEVIHWAKVADADQAERYLKDVLVNGRYRKEYYKVDIGLLLRAIDLAGSVYALPLTDYEQEWGGRIRLMAYVLDHSHEEFLKDSLLRELEYHRDERSVTRLVFCFSSYEDGVCQCSSSASRTYKIDNVLPTNALRAVIELSKEVESCDLLSLCVTESQSITKKAGTMQVIIRDLPAAVKDMDSFLVNRFGPLVRMLQQVSNSVVAREVTVLEQSVKKRRGQQA